MSENASASSPFEGMGDITRDELFAKHGIAPSDAALISGDRSYVSWYGGERRQSWATPPEFFDRLHAEYGFTLDGASEIGNGLLDRASTAEDPVAWTGERVFCNPPWSNIRPFVEMAATADLAVLLVPARTNCKWFHRALALGAEVRFFPRKIKFVGAPHVSPVDCVLLVFDNGEEASRAA